MSTVIAVDAMGGDRAPGAAVERAVLAAARTGTSVLLVGPEAILDAAELLREHAKIRWLIVGDGRAGEWVKAEIQRRGIEAGSGPFEPGDAKRAAGRSKSSS